MLVRGETHTAKTVEGKLKIHITDLDALMPNTVNCTSKVKHWKQMLK